MIRGGGHLLLATPANNWCGHGFYQFSPELFFSVLTKENGFQIMDMTAITYIPNFWGDSTESQFFHMDDNTATGHRLFFNSKFPVLLHICAKRTGYVPPPGKLKVQQSDYVRSWDKKAPVKFAPDGFIKSKIKSILADRKG